VKHGQFLQSLAVIFFGAAIAISASAQTREQIAAMQAQIAARQAPKDSNLVISQHDALPAQPEDATLAAIHRDSLLEDATLAASQRDSLQNQPKIGKADAHPNQQDIANAADQFQPQPEPQSATSEDLPALAPAKLQAENEQATASQNQAHRSASESARRQRIHRIRETRTQNSASSTIATPFLSQVQNQWNRFWRIRSNSKRSGYHSNE
jgi:uncharacterized protein YdaL